MLFFVIFGLIIAIAAILFAFQNSAIVAIKFGIWEFQESLAIVLLITLGLGIIISLLLSIPTLVKRGWKSSNQNKKITDLEYKLQSRSEQISRQEKISEILQNNIQELHHLCREQTVQPCPSKLVLVELLPIQLML